jgi:hypothetical protein
VRACVRACMRVCVREVNRTGHGEYRQNNQVTCYIYIYIYTIRMVYIYMLCHAVWQGSTLGTGVRGTVNRYVYYVVVVGFDKPPEVHTRGSVTTKYDVASGKV